MKTILTRLKTTIMRIEKNKIEDWDNKNRWCRKCGCTQFDELKIERNEMKGEINLCKICQGIYFISSKKNKTNAIFIGYISNNEYKVVMKTRCIDENIIFIEQNEYL